MVLVRSLALLLLGALACGRIEPPPGESSAALEGDPRPLRPTELLRRLSFDLRGIPPTADEYRAVQAAGDVDEAQVEELLRSDEFLDQVERWHAEILWPNISRYRLTAAPLVAVVPRTYQDWEDIGWATHGSVGADPTLVDDAEARQVHAVAFEDESTGITLRGGRHARSAHFCDLRPEAEYPDPSVVGTPANRYSVAADESGSGVAYEATYYSEDPDHYGMVMPIRDWEHCQNYCFLTACGDPASVGDHRDVDGDLNHDCYSDMTASGDDPAGRHELDVPGMRCPEGYERLVNSCDYAVEFAEGGRGSKPGRGGARDVPPPTTRCATGGDGPRTTGRAGSPSGPAPSRRSSGSMVCCDGTKRAYR